MLYGFVGVSLIVLQRFYQVCVHVPRAQVVLLQKDFLFRSRIDLLERLVFAIARVRGTRVVFDIDDAVYLGTSVVNLPHLDAKIRRLAGAASIVLAGSDPIASHLRSASKAVQLAPTCLVLQGRPSRPPSPSAKVMRLVWVGTASNGRYLELLSAPLRRLVGQALVRIQLVTRLADLPNKVIEGLPDVLLTEWSESAEVNALAASDIAVAPLFDEPFARAKCGGKVLSYFAAGLPVIASPVGGQAIMVRHDETGLIATTQDEWSECLNRLCGDRDLRDRLGQAGRFYLERNRSAQHEYARWRRWVLGPSDEGLETFVADHLPVA
jgi:glycosyltransferase involved in cell wall biosynthesis